VSVPNPQAVPWLETYLLILRRSLFFIGFAFLKREKNASAPRLAFHWHRASLNFVLKTRHRSNVRYLNVDQAVVVIPVKKPLHYAVMVLEKYKQ